MQAHLAIHGNRYELYRYVFKGGQSNPKLKINVQNIKLFFQDNLSLFYMAQMLHFYKRWSKKKSNWSEKF